MTWGSQGKKKKKSIGRGLQICLTNLALLDACVDGVEKVGPVLITFGQLSELFPQQLAFVVAHHPFKGWVDVL